LEITMRALVCHAPKDLRLEELQPEVLGAQQLRVRVAFGGICGSDLHYIDANQAHAVADDLPLSQAAMAEPLSVGLHAIARVGSVVGKRVLVTGCGPIGALLIAALRRAGAAHIFDQSEEVFKLACDKSKSMKVQIAFDKSLSF
jgi:threonine dehydrogenase-like Zn-dependent dehydrogenase